MSRIVILALLLAGCEASSGPGAEGAACVTIGGGGLDPILMRCDDPQRRTTCWMTTRGGVWCRYRNS